MVKVTVPESQVVLGAMKSRPPVYAALRNMQGVSGKTHRLRRGMGKDCTKNRSVQEPVGVKLF
jgi:hypothetical protein